MCAIWDAEKYNLGLDPVDAEHKILFDIAHAMSLCETLSEVRKYIPKFLDAFVIHVTNEEDWMRRVNYPHLETHLITHQHLQSIILGFESPIWKKEVTVKFAANVLQQIFLLHIESEDKRFYDYLKANNLSLKLNRGTE